MVQNGCLDTKFGRKLSPQDQQNYCTYRKNAIIPLIPKAILAISQKDKAGTSLLLSIQSELSSVPMFHLPCSVLVQWTIFTDRTLHHNTTDSSNAKEYLIHRSNSIYLAVH